MSDNRCRGAEVGTGDEPDFDLPSREARRSRGWRGVWSRCFSISGREMGSRGLVRDQRGVAAVEFGLIVVIMFVMMAGAVDLSLRIIFQRDLKRFTTSAALALANCKDGGGGCAGTAIQEISGRMALLLPGIATTELRLGTFSLVNGKIVWGPGLTNVFQGTEEAQAKAMLSNEGDSGVLVSVKATHDPIFPSFAAKWGLVSQQFYEYTMQLSYRKV
ncbi:TadE/TadG family type IV pilus assembly protein [Bosea sp. NPDC003192]|uniref:TadE/TadG family type IV pilus assembly protein n=1 Tax=Bosea sp. NPDC003192 TaxID=3390551 RepID=UPI003D00E27B